MIMDETSLAVDLSHRNGRIDEIFLIARSTVQQRLLICYQQCLIKMHSKVETALAEEECYFH